MNTSTNTNQILRRGMVGALLASAITTTVIGLAATAHADDAPSLAGPAHVGANCQTDPWGFLGSQRRTLCDGPVSSDGSWSRERTIWAPAHYSTPICTSRSGSSSSSYTSCSGGYYIDERLMGNETYPVRPDTVLPDEPGHLG
jgi:hypothetical protein